MRRYPIIVLCIVLIVGLTACGGDGADDEVLPTQVQIEEETPEVEQLDVTPTAEINASDGRPTLPPSWTPEPEMTNTPVPEPTVFETQPPPTVRPECAAFRIDQEQSTDQITLGENPVLAWTEVPGAGSYRVRLFDEDLNPITDDPPIAVDNVYTLSGEFFFTEGRYAWQVEPLDAEGIQMCNGLGDLLIVTE